MIKRYYFVRIESKPTLIESRKLSGKITICTTVVCIQSFFEKPNDIIPFALDSASEMAETLGYDFKKDEIIVTLVNRI